jgi:Histidine kinase-, DNA gyrase B-, and HSP90-like ATPase
MSAYLQWRLAEKVLSSCRRDRGSSRSALLFRVWWGSNPRVHQPQEYGHDVYLDESYAASQVEVVPGQYVMIAVPDSGSGRPPDVLAKAFDPFVTTKDVGHGTRLGLSQVYGFAKQSGGHVKIYSEIGEGTTVKPYFPRVHAAVLHDENGGAQVVARGSANETILVVEDDADVRSYSSETLRIRIQRP